MVEVVAQNHARRAVALGYHGRVVHPSLPEGRQAVTRKEISERAALLTMAVTLKLTGSGADMIEAATDKMVDFHRATLQEAARAVCKRCALEFPERDDRGIYYWHNPGPYGSILCDADRIHDLIAALDKEGS